MECQRFAIGCATGLLLLLAIGWPSGAHAWQIDRDLLWAISQRESAGDDTAKGDHDGTDYQSYGRFQIKVDTAAFLIGLNDPNDAQREVLKLILQDRVMAHRFAELMAEKCAKQGYKSRVGQAWCWNRGWNSGRARHDDPYVQAVLKLWRDRRKALAQR